MRLVHLVHKNLVEKLSSKQHKKLLNFILYCHCYKPKLASHQDTLKKLWRQKKGPKLLQLSSNFKLNPKERSRTGGQGFMSASELPLVPPPSGVSQVGLSHLRPASLDLQRTGGHKMGYHTGIVVGGCCPPGVGGGVGAHLSRQDVMTYSQYVNGSIFSVPKSWQVDHGENLVLSVYTFLKTFIGASGSNQGAIDNRIEQAMDLVKSHLMNAVRSEVEELKEKIIKLEDIITQLQTENEFLRANVNRDVLMQLQQQQQLQMQQQQALPSPPSQPALPPAQQPSI